jgi:ABC-2 type transport system ATP-binding protein
MTTAIETAGLTKSYGSVRAIQDLSISVEAGQVFAFLGPNGSGKSTTIRLLLALQRPTSGSARILGLDSQEDYVEIHRQVGYMPGDLELFPRLTGQHHIDWFAKARGEVDSGHVSELIRRFDVVLDRPIKELSKGNCQKIGVVLSFMSRPKLLILDEPTSGLDPLMQHEFGRLIRETVADGATVFLSSHDLDEVQLLADRVAIIKEGRLLVVDTVEGLGQTVPRKVEVRFREAVPRSLFESIPGVRVTAQNGNRLSMELAGEIAPLLRVIADNNPAELVSRPANLEEMFLSYYRDSSLEGSNAN